MFCKCVVHSVDNTHCSSTGVKELPTTITSLAKLRTLRVSFNKLYHLPNDIGSLSRLREVFATGCSEHTLSIFNFIIPIHNKNRLMLILQKSFSIDECYGLLHSVYCRESVARYSSECGQTWSPDSPLSFASTSHSWLLEPGATRLCIATYVHIQGQCVIHEPSSLKYTPFQHSHSSCSCHALVHSQHSLLSPIICYPARIRLYVFLRNTWFNTMRSITVWWFCDVCRTAFLWYPLKSVRWASSRPWTCLRIYWQAFLTRCQLGIAVCFLVIRVMQSWSDRNPRKKGFVVVNHFIVVSFILLHGFV